MEGIPVSNMRSFVRCGAVLLLFGLLILNWRAPIGISLSSSNLNVVVFCLAAVAAPVFLTIAARSFTPVIRWLVWVLAGAMHVLIFFIIGIVALSTFPTMRRGAEVEPLVRSIPSPLGRIAVYQVETGFSGVSLCVRLERTVFPGVSLARDLAFVDSAELGKLVLHPPNVLCLSFEPLSTAGGSTEQATLIIQPLLTWAEPLWIDDSSATGVSADAECLP